ncbi:SpoIIE family protein phosphatase [Streptomyces sp. AF1A]|jgi:serine phosphatase RsbU (regulator of sigma subunit)/anti-sigma regulatory factor (Ser/Thr protein kinase)|uniref:SpoIIE family protein phosphatase n=1 Tax=Streptomyces sp. AF1A TaxID=3394350 RepID=UPI0039BCE5D3
MAASLRRLFERLHPATAAVYLLTDDTGALAASMVLDTALGFTVAPGMPVDDFDWAGAAAQQTGEIVVRDSVSTRWAIESNPAVVQYLPYPVLTVAAPLRTARKRFGVLVLRWAPPRDPDSAMLDCVRSVAEQLSTDLERSAEQGASMVAPPVPWFVPVSTDGAGPVSQGASATAPPIRPTGPSGSSSFLYQFQRVATELTAGVRAQDIVATTHAEVVRPFGGDGVTLYLIEQGRLRVAGSAGSAKSALKAVDYLPLTPGAPEADAVIKNQSMMLSTAQLRAGYPGLNRYHEGAAWLFLPLIADRQVVGCSVVRYDHLQQLRDDELAALMIMFGQVGQSLQRVRSHEWAASIARTLQQGLLPGSFPHLKEIVATARYLPATQGAEAGGDWYDVISLPGGGAGLLIGDVEGHSLEAAGIMAQLRSGARAYATEGHDPAAVLARSNRLLAGLDTRLFATCCCIWLDLDTGEATIASAGHPMPVISDPSGRVSTPVLSAGPPLGICPETVYIQVDTVLAPGSLVALYTDGLLDLSHQSLETALGTLRQRLADQRDLDLEVLADRLVSDDGPHTARDDDLALLLVRYEGASESAAERVARVSIQRNGLHEVRRLRHFLTDLMNTWMLSVDIDALELLVSEVVTNSLVHAQSEVDVRLRNYPDHLRVEVRDTNPHPPVMAAIVGADEAVNDEAESGRGLLIVNALAAAWGTSPAGRGKTTWFELDVSSHAATS